MNFKKITCFIFCLFIFSIKVTAEEVYNVFGNLDLLNQAQIPVITKNDNIRVGYAKINFKQMQNIRELSHDVRSCSGFEVISQQDFTIRSAEKQLNDLTALVKKEKNYKDLIYLYSTQVQPRPEITVALDQVQSNNIRDFVQWLSSFESRYARLKDPNQHVRQMYEKLNQLLKTSALKTELNFVEHNVTSQKSLQVRIIGKSKPNEVIVLGAHFDSISGWMGDGKAPGADDNASGSASIFEALRIMLMQPQPERTIEFYWYAGEELGLLGSAEIAKKAKAENKNIVGVLNFDMAMFPGDGENNITLMTDFTSARMNELAKAVNNTYLKVNVTEDECGYGCSDHASWFRSGYPTLMAAEAGFHSIFPDLHTPRDVISDKMSFTHAAIFSKLALAMAMELASQ